MRRPEFAHRYPSSGVSTADPRAMPESIKARTSTEGDQAEDLSKKLVNQSENAARTCSISLYYRGHDAAGSAARKKS